MDLATQARVSSARVSVLLVVSGGLLSGCTLIGGVDEFTDANGGRAADDGSDPGSGGSGAGDVGACADCDDRNPCTQETCVAGACSRAPIDGPCVGGVCEDGRCTDLLEDCANRVDDNGDGLVDCADPICGGLGYRCVPTTPVGWMGPAAWASGESVSCSGAYDELLDDGQAGLRADPATCAPCSCEAGDGQCPKATVTVSRAFGDDCSGLCNGPLLLKDGECKRLTDADASCWDGGGDSIGNPSVVSVTVGAWPGSCTATGGAAAVSPIAWDASVTVCGAVGGGGCDADAVCAPPPPPTFEPSACVAHEGDVECPTRYPAKTVLYEGVEDSRACTACSCAAGSCRGSLLLYDDSCGDGHLESEVGAPFTGSCLRPESEDPRARYVVDRSAVCESTPAVPAGQATPIEPTTVCCRAE